MQESSGIISVLQESVSGMHLLISELFHQSFLLLRNTIPIEWPLQLVLKSPVQSGFLAQKKKKTETEISPDIF